MLLALAGCETVVEVDVPAHEERLAMEAVLRPNERGTLDIWLTRSYGLRADAPISSVPDATVQLFRADTLVATARHARDRLFGHVYEIENLVLQPGRPYTLRAQTSDQRMAPVVATTWLPEPVETDIQASLTTTTQPDGLIEVGYRIELTLSDPPGPTFYRVEAELGVAPYNQWGDYVAYFSTRDRAILNEYEPTELNRDGTFVGQEAFFSDALFDGTDYEVSIDVPLDKFRSGPIHPDDIEWRGVHLTLEVLSADYYAYRRTLRLQEHHADNPFAESMPVHSNVDAGYGIFAGVWPQHTWLPITASP